MLPLTLPPVLPCSDITNSPPSTTSEYPGPALPGIVAISGEFARGPPFTGAERAKKLRQGFQRCSKKRAIKICGKISEEDLNIRWFARSGGQPFLQLPEQVIDKAVQVVEANTSRVNHGFCGLQEWCMPPEIPDCVLRIEFISSCVAANQSAVGEHCKYRPLGIRCMSSMFMVSAPVSAFLGTGVKFVMGATYSVGGGTGNIA